jgi:hypothetical protein
MPMDLLTYEDNDPELKYVEDLSKIVRLILKLCARCQTGAAKKPSA